MGCAPVVFDYTLWVSQYPEFASVSLPQAEVFFDLATIIQRNDGTGPVTNPKVQLNLLNLMTSHICSLSTQGLGDPAPGAPKAGGPVGRISNATEGTVSVATDYGTTISQQQAWCIQTRYGASWWAMTAVYRTMQYVPGRLQPGGFGGYPGFGGSR